MFRRKRTYTYTPYNNYSRRGIRWDRVIPVVLGILVVLIIVLVFNFSRIQLFMKGYNFEEQNAILDMTSEKIDMVVDDDKMDHILTWLEESKRVDLYDEFEKYYQLHPDMESKDIIKRVKVIFDEKVPALKKLQYSNKQIWKILKNASETDLDYLIQHQYTYTTIKPFMKVKGFKYTDVKEYLKVYASKKNYNYAVLSVSYPFIISKNKTDKKYYITDPEKYNTLVKKGFYLKSDYVPEDLVTPDMPIDKECKKNKHDKLRKDAADALVKMYKDALKEDYHLVVNSGYRSYKEQQETYNSYTARWGGIYAREHVALPGASEHQTGLGVDLTSQSVVEKKRLVFGDTAEYKWVCKNAYKYGYILRFADGTSSITGITQEPWHFRYVGKAAAKEIYENNWTLEEYCLYKGIIPTLSEK